MKKLVCMMAMMMASSAFTADSVSTVTCVVKEEFSGKKVNVKVEFLVKNLGSDKAQLVAHPKTKEEDMESILVSPKEVDGVYANMTHLNGQGGDLRVKKDRIYLFGDGDGYTFVDLVLFKDSSYKKGYVRVYGSGDQMYQKLSCSIK